MPVAGTRDSSEQTSSTSTARGASEKGGSGSDTIRLVDARGGAQGRNV